MAGAEVLVIDGGGRGVALDQALEKSSEVDRVVVAPNFSEGKEYFTGPVKPFVVIGPETPLVDGLADYLRKEGYTVFGVGAKAARYEASKSFAALMMMKYGIRHPYTRISRSFGEDQTYALEHKPEDYVIKADGLAGGKGVILPSTRTEAMDTVREMRFGKRFGDAGWGIINFSDRHSGPEISAMVVVGDNDEHIILPLSQDHKRRDDGDKGPNTGGMGAYAPVPLSIVSAEQRWQIGELAEQSLAGMRADKSPFGRGVLYIGAMLSEQFGSQPAVIEYNVRFGDPETQVLMPLLIAAGVDVYRLLYSAATGDLEIQKGIDYSHFALSALTVCLAAPGYPKEPQLGGEVYGLGSELPGVTVQHAGIKNGNVSSGRALYVTATGKSLLEARNLAYAAIDTEKAGRNSGKIGIIPDMQFRSDIARQALQAGQNG